MSSYLGRHAELYDLFYQDKAYEQEARFAASLAREQGIAPPARWLDVACGSGRHAFALEQLGFNVAGVDYSPSQLAQANQSKQQRHSHVTFAQQDMRQLNVPARPFDVVSCLFDSIGYVQTNEAVLEALRCMHAHLRPGGLLVMEFWHAAGMLKSYDPVRIRRWTLPDRQIVRISETTVDVARQLCHVQYSVHELLTDGRCHRFTETQTNRFFLVQEMDLLLTTTGFKSVSWHAGYDRERTIDSGTFHVVVAATKLS